MRNWHGVPSTPTSSTVKRIFTADNADNFNRQANFRRRQRRQAQSSNEFSPPSTPTSSIVKRTVDFGDDAVDNFNRQA
ncbi:MAG: hypothetical protein IJ774_10145 [Selenomonadaceae bacterium]|nr:hypothetical protein [Selenomonadaceae bacterium]